MPSISLPVAAIGISVLGGAVSIMGQLQQGQNAKAAAEYNAKVSEQNAQIKQQSAQRIMQAGQAQVAQEGMKNRAKMGGIIANQAASGLDVNSGSTVDVRSSAAELGQLDALNIRRNAVEQAYGQEVGATNATAQAAQDRFQGQAAEQSAAYGAAGTFLGTAGSAASNWAKYQQAAPSNISSGDSFGGYEANYDYGSSSGYEGYNG